VQGKKLLNHSGIRNRGYVEVYLGFPHILFLFAVHGLKGVVKLDGNSHRTQMKMAMGGERHEHNLHGCIYVYGQALEGRTNIGTCARTVELKEYFGSSFKTAGLTGFQAKTHGSAQRSGLDRCKAAGKDTVNKL
jgi:hypothetical protein